MPKVFGFADSTDILPSMETFASTMTGSDSMLSMLSVCTQQICSRANEASDGSDFPGDFPGDVPGDFPEMNKI